MIQQLLTHEASAQREIRHLLAGGFNAFIPVLRFSSSSAHDEGGDGGSEAARPSPFVAGE